MPPPNSSDPPSPASAPKFVAPGIYVEEVHPGVHPIAGVPTSTAAFIGPTVSGPVGTASEIITSYVQFQHIYSDAPQISFAAPLTVVRNYLALAVRAFFENGGNRLYVGRVTAADGTNSAAPTADDYARALSTLEGLHEVAVVAAPGGSIDRSKGVASVAPIHAALIAHASVQGAYRFAVLDPPPGCTLDDIQSLRSQLESKNAALYYPWITVADPAASPKPNAQIDVPPSGFVCGIYARTDMQRGVFKAPANQPIIGAIGFEHAVTSGENDLLNPLGINCLRTFPGRGNLVWGARTVSSDPEWKYVNVRRYFIYLEHSIDQGTQWAVFEPNTEQLWASVRQAVSNFLYSEWRSGALMGVKPEEAYFVRCDRTTMTQNDLDNGRLICLVGVAPITPAEFVIFSIAQLTAHTN